MNSVMTREVFSDQIAMVIEMPDDVAVKEVARWSEVAEAVMQFYVFRDSDPEVFIWQECSHRLRRGDAIGPFVMEDGDVVRRGFALWRATPRVSPELQV